MNRPYTQDMTLSKAPTASFVKIVRITGGSSFKSKMISMGLMPGTEVEILNCDGCVGPMAIRVNQTRVVIGRGMADKIVVEPVCKEKQC